MDGGHEAGVDEGLLGGSAVGGVFGIGDGDGADGGSAQRVEREAGDAGVVARPEDEGAACVGNGCGRGSASAVDDVLGVGHVGGHEEIEGGLVEDLHGESGGGVVGGQYSNAGFLLELVKYGRQDGLEVSGGGEAQRMLCDLGMRGAGRDEEEGGNDGEEEQSAKFLRHAAP